VRKGPDEGCYFYGLYLEGSRWDKSGNKLADSEPKVLFAPLPVLHVTGKLEDKDKAASGTPQYNCPCYKNPKRTGLNFIFEVNLRSEEHASKWVLRGVCLLTSTDA
jgi:dynein heavy chain